VNPNIPLDKEYASIEDYYTERNAIKHTALE
jgi:hypothetical protein